VTRGSLVAAGLAVVGLGLLLGSPVLLRSDLDSPVYCGPVFAPRSGPVFVGQIPANRPFPLTGSSGLVAPFWEHRFTDVCAGAVAWRWGDAALAAVIAATVFVRRGRLAALVACGIVAALLALIDGPVIPLVILVAAAIVGAVTGRRSAVPNTASG
jgi:hypothetical protein